MKLTIMAAAGLSLLTGLVATAPAAAQERVVVRERTVVTPAPTTRTHVEVRERSTVRRDYGYRRHPRRVCTVRYRHGDRIRTCRTVYR